MKYLLIITALVTAIVAIKGDTWDSSNSGLRKITLSGWAVALLALITASVSIYIERVEQTVKSEKKVENDHKRFHTLEQLVDDFHQIELLAFEFEKNSDLSEILIKVRLHTKFIKDSIELNSNILTQQELFNFENFIRFSNEEIVESESGSDFMNDSPMPELARFAREMRFRLCEPMLGKSSYCNYLQLIPTANEFFAHEDPRMLEAMSQAKKTLPEALLKISELKTYNTELQVKVAIPVGDGSREHMWLGNVNYKNNKIIGNIGNEPVDALHIRFDQIYTAELDDVTDWMVIKNGVVYGGYMLRVNLSRMSDYELKRFYTHFKHKIPEDILLL
jgi:uncharacterized protein YegJ (DUF2314 family)